MRVAFAALCALILSACKPDPVPDPDPKPLTACETPGPTASKTPDWEWEVRSVVYIPHTSDLKAWFIDSLTGYIAGRDLQKTTNGGKNWTKIPMQENDVATALCFTDLQHGFVFGYKQNDCVTGCESFMMRTSDGGQTWDRRVLTGIGKFYFNEVIMTDNLNGIAYGADRVEFAYIFRTSDGGLTWEPRHVIIGGTWVPNKLQRVSDGIMCISARDSLYLSNDLFQTWEVAAQPRFTRILFDGPGYAIGAGDGSWMTSRDTGRTWQNPIHRKIYPFAINKKGQFLSQVMGDFCQPFSLGYFPATWANIQNNLVTQESEPFASMFFQSVQRVGKYVFVLKPLWISEGTNWNGLDQVQVIRITDNNF
jgi:photosystem II stability/assembly factor-like uncharacterized protein